MLFCTKYCQVADIAVLWHCCVVEFEPTSIFRDSQLTALVQCDGFIAMYATLAGRYVDSFL
jgi:hypothetical protein